MPPKQSSGSSTAKKNKENYEKLEGENKQLKMQCALFREKFDYEKVQRELSTFDLPAMLTDENRKLNQKVKELESAIKNNDKPNSSAQSKSNSTDVGEKHNKHTENKHDKMTNGETQRQRSARANNDAMQSSEKETLKKKLEEVETINTQLNEKVRGKESQIQQLQNQLGTAYNRIEELEKNTRPKQEKDNEIQKPNEEDNQILGRNDSDMKKQLQEVRRKVEQLKSDLEKQAEIVKELRNDKSQLEEQLKEAFDKQEKLKDNELKKKGDKPKSENDALKKREEIVKSNESELKKKGDALNSKENELKKREADVIDKEKEVEGRESQLKTNEDAIKEKIDQLENKSKTLSLTEIKLQEKEKSMGNTNNTNDTPTKAELNPDLKKKENQLNNKEDELKKREDTVKKNEDVLKEGEEALKNKDDEQKKKTDTLNSKENELKKREADVKIKEKEVKERQSLEQLLKDKESENGKLNKQLSEKERDVADLQAKLRKQETTRGTNNTSTSAKSFKRELEKANIEIEELKTRLSKVVGAQITDGNPDIADLSDLNRPTKLAERYAELYDNEWTDAYEEIEGSGLKEEETIKRLLETLKRVYTFCQDVSKDYEKGIKTSALVIPGSDKGRPKTPNLPATSRKQIVELRKTFAPTLTEDVFKQYVKSLKQPLDKSPKTKLFVKTCIEICWLMSIQDPPVVLDTGNPKGPFDGDKYRTYTRSGKTFDYIVWPPLRLHEAGALLGKGVAQAK